MGPSSLGGGPFFVFSAFALSFLLLLNPRRWFIIYIILANSESVIFFLSALCHINIPSGRQDFHTDK